MKKRIFMLALVVGILLSFSASAWATTISSIVADPTSLSLGLGESDTKSDTVTLTFTNSGTAGTATPSVAIKDSSGATSTGVTTSWSSGITNGKTASITKSGTKTATLSITAATAGTYTVTVTTAEGGTCDISVTVAAATVTVEDAPAPKFKTTSITGLKAGTDLGDGKVIELTQSEEKLGTVTWAISDADVEKLATYGLEFSTETHALTGTPTQSGTFSFTVTASNYKGETLQETAQAISVTISGTKPSFLSWMPADKANMGKTTSATEEMIGPFFRNGVLVKDRAIAPFAEETTDGTDETNESLPRRNGDGDGEETEPTESDTQQFILGVQGTLPITVTVTGLPTGLTATQADEAGKTVLDIGGEQAVSPNGETATYDGTNGTAWVVITGTPTKAAVNKSVKITAKNADGEISRTYTMEVLARPTLKTTSVKATWGKALKTTLKADGGTKDHVITWSVASGDLPDGLSLDHKTGELTGTYQWNDGGDVFGATDKTHTFSVWIMPENDAGTAEDEPTSKTKVDIVMSLAKPVITNKKAKVTYGGETAIALSSIPTMKVDTPIDPIYIVVNGGGALTWTSGDLPAGLSVAMAEGYSGTTEDVDTSGNESLPRRNGEGEGEETENPQEVDSSIVIYGTPTDTAKNQSVKFQVANAAGNDSVALKFNITATELEFPVTGEDGGATELPGATLDYTTYSAGYAVGGEVSVHLVAKPGPVTFSAKNLPAGITLSADKKGGTDAWLVGTYTKATKTDKKGQNVVTITATNKNITDKTKGVKTLSADWRVFEAPEITTTKLSDLTTGKKYTGKIAVKNAGAANIFVYIHENATPTTDQLSTPLTWEDKFNLSEKSNYSLRWSSDIMAIVGSLDRMPDAGQIYVSIAAENPAGEAELVTLPLKVKGQAPKLTTSKLKAFTSGSASDATTAQDITTQGTQPITLRAYIDNKTAKAFGWVDSDSTASIDITSTAAQIDDVTTNPTGFVFVPTLSTATSETTDDGEQTDGGARPRNNGDGDGDTAEPTGKGKLYFLGADRTIGEATLTGRASYKGLPITFVATNAASTKPTTKAIKVDVEKGLDPVIMFTPQDPTPTVNATTGLVESYSVAEDMVEMSRDVTVYAAAGTLTSMTFKVSGDTPVTISAKGDKNGVTSTVAEGDPTTLTITGAEIPTTKEIKTVITITALNPSTKKKAVRKLTVIQPLAPTITTAEKGLTKEVELGKKFSLKLSAKGSKTIKWSIVEGDDVTTNTKAELVALGLSLDQKGAITGTPVCTTSADSDGVPTYSPMTFTVKAENAGGSVTTVVTVGVKGVKPKLVTKTITISTYNPALDKDSAKVFTNIAKTDTKSYVKFKFVDGEVNGLTLAADPDNRNTGILSGTPTTATKGTSAKIEIENLGTTVTGSIKLIVRDEAPEIEGNADISLSASATEKASAETTLTLKSEPTDGAKINWKITKKPTTKGITLKLKGNGASATLTVTVPKKFAGGDATFTVSATNGNSKLSGTIDGTISVTAAPEETDESALPDDESALPDEEAAENESETETDEPAETETEPETATEGEIALGTARTEAQLTAEQRAFLEKNGYVIAAILPEMSVTADDQYDIDVELNENAPEGAELVWFAFPSTATTDDDIVDFYDEAGASVEGVPASHKIIASPWLNEGVTYAPVIAVKTVNAGGARDTLEGAEEGAVVTEEALETAAAPAE